MPKANKPKPIKAFCDMPDTFRLAVRDKIHEAGGSLTAYLSDGYIIVYLPNEDTDGLISELEKMGMKEHGPARVFFPLGSDNPARSMRHDNPRYSGLPGCEGNYLCGYFYVAEDRPRPNVQFVIVDEASGVADGIFDAMRGYLTSANSYVLLIGNGNRATGAFYESHRVSKGLEPIPPHPDAYEPISAEEL